MNPPQIETALCLRLRRIPYPMPYPMPYQEVITAPPQEVSTPPPQEVSTTPPESAAGGVERYRQEVLTPPPKDTEDQYEPPEERWVGETKSRMR